MSRLPNLPKGFKNLKKLDDTKRERYKKAGLCRRYRRSSYIMFEENKCDLAKQYKNQNSVGNSNLTAEEESGKEEATA